MAGVASFDLTISVLKFQLSVWPVWAEESRQTLNKSCNASSGEIKLGGLNTGAQQSKKEIYGHKYVIDSWIMMIELKKEKQKYEEKKVW